MQHHGHKVDTIVTPTTCGEIDKGDLVSLMSAMAPNIGNAFYPQRLNQEHHIACKVLVLNGKNHLSWTCEQEDMKV